MKSYATRLVMAAFLVLVGALGCSGGSNGSEMGAGGVAASSGGTGATGGSSAGSGGGAGTGAGDMGSGGSGGVPCESPSLDNAGFSVHPLPAQIDITCAAVAPAENEDGSYTRVVFGPFCDGDSVNGAAWLALGEPTNAIPDPWAVGLALVPAALDPMTASCAGVVADRVLIDQGAVPLSDSAEAHRLTYTMITPYVTATGDHVVLCVRNGVDVVGGLNTALLACGQPGDGSSADQWEDIDGTIHAMVEYGPAFNVPWAASVF